MVWCGSARKGCFNYGLCFTLLVGDARRLGFGLGLVRVAKWSYPRRSYLIRSPGGVAIGTTIHACGEIILNGKKVSVLFDQIKTEAKVTEEKIFDLGFNTTSELAELRGSVIIRKPPNCLLDQPCTS